MKSQHIDSLKVVLNGLQLSAQVHGLDESSAIDLTYLLKSELECWLDTAGLCDEEGNKIEFKYGPQ